ncbi:MAG: cytochrome c peroxidase [Kiritimatiellia bacterium]|jgi:cytochrome c peroxidase
MVKVFRVLSITLLVSLPVLVQAQFEVLDEMFPPADAAKEELGKLLFSDKILSGNQNISCATCHHAFAGTGDGLSLPVGAGGLGFGVARSAEGKMGEQVVERVPRNAPALFNLGASSFDVLFHDGRVAADDTQASGFLNPAGDDLPPNLDNPLAVQAMFPVQSGAEMAGQPGENAIADAAAAGNLSGPDGVWPLLAERLQANVDYVSLFVAAYSHIQEAADIEFVDAANAIGAFEASAWRCNDTPFDRAVGSDGAQSGPDVLDSISPKVLRGAELFYGKAECSSCHSGPFQTDLQFYAIAVPQIGPGKGNGPDGLDDFGREAVSGDTADRFKFRTPSLRQVAYTGPWGHDGAYGTLEAMVRHHLDPVASLNDYDTTQARLAVRSDFALEDFLLHADAQRREDIAAANELNPVELTDPEISDLIEFLTVGLTDTSCVDLRRDVPDSVPSGLPLAD